MANYTISKIQLPNGDVCNIKDTTYSAGTGIGISGTTISNTGVTGIKGNSESSYRTGQVNLTAANIGAIPSNTAGNTQNLSRPTGLRGLNDVTLQPLINTTRANRLAFLPADQIIIEKTTDGGTTWVDAGVADSTKVGLFSETRASINIPLLNGVKSTLCGIRVTISAMKYNIPSGTSETQKYSYWSSTYVSRSERYCQLKEFYFWLSASNDSIGIKIERATGASPNNWQTTFEDSTYYMTGWSGCDYIQLNWQSTFGGSTSQTNNHWNYRLTFMTRGVNGTDTMGTGYETQSQSIMEIRGYGDTWWTKSNEYMASDHLYGWDYYQNAIFPADILPKVNNTKNLGNSSYKWSNVYATTFTGNLTGNVTGNVSGSAGSVALSGVTEADDLKAIEALSGTSGLLKKTAANTWSLDTTTYLSSHQTIIQDGITGATINRFGTCSTSASTAAKTVSITSGTFSLEAGARVTVKFSNANTAGTPTLNVNSKGAKNIYHRGAQITTGDNKALLAGTVDFVYDGTQWHLIGNYYDTTYSSQTAANGGTTLSLVTTGEKYTWNNKTSNTGTVTSITPGNGLLNGTGTSAITTSGTLNLSYGTSTQKIGTAAAGSANTVSRSDHVHAIDLATGDSNGQVKVAGTNISVKGLAGAAYKAVDTSIDSNSSSTNLPTSAAVASLVSSAFAANDAMIFKGTIAGGSTGNYGELTAAANRGDTYKVSTAGKINGITVEVGDILICTTDSTAAATSSNYSTIASNWTIVQNNVDGAIFKGSNTFVDGDILLADGTNGKIKDSGIKFDNSTTTKWLTQKGTWGTVSKSDVGLGNVTNDAQIPKSIFTEAYQILYSTGSATYAVLTANKSTTKKFLRMTGASSSAGAAPVWDTVTSTDVGLGNVSNNSNLNNTTGSKGDIIYWSAANTPAHLTNTSSTTKQALTITSQTPSWVNISPSISITAGTSSAAPQVNVSVLGVSGTAQSITTASTSAYGVTKLNDGISSNSTTLAATANSALIAAKKVASSNNTSKLYLVGATSQSTTGVDSYSYQYTYTNNGLLSALKVGLNLNGTEKAHLEWNDTDQSIDFIFE